MVPATLKALRKLPRLQALPIVFITAKTQLDEVEKLKKMGAQAVIKKPFDPKKLSEQLRSIWQEATQARGLITTFASGQFDGNFYLIVAVFK